MNRLEVPKSNYTIVPNEIFKLELSAETRFTYIYLLSKPTGWQIKVSDLQRRLQCGRQKAYRMIKELREAGLLSFEKKNNGEGVYTLHEITKCRKASSGFPSSGFSSPLVSTERAVITKRANKHYSNEFERWWKTYPKKVGKKKTYSIWKRIKPDADLLIADTLNRIANDDKWKRGYIKDPERYLSNEQWEDEVTQPKPEDLTEAQKYELRQQRTAAILQELNDSTLGHHVEALPPAMDENQR